ncbi:MAG: PKD domain-containing protein [Actinophytocola sp.]|uniref:PKD domain-containing protein n=1 Tax=Actinophytocola sp. TaxID=1872138 RepID=UPI003C771222
MSSASRSADVNSRRKGRQLVRRTLIAIAVAGLALFAAGPAGAQEPRSWTVYATGNQIDVPGIVTPIDTATNTAGPPVTVFDSFGIAVTPDAATAYVTARSNDQVVRIDTATNSIIGDPIDVGVFPTGIAITPDGSTVYTADQNGGSVTPIDTATNTAGPPIQLLPPAETVFTHRIAITPDGTKAYVVVRGSTETPVQVIPIAIASEPPVVLPAITMANGQLFDIAVTPDGATVYIIDNANDQVITINTADDTLGASIAVPDDPLGIAITPDGAKAYVASQRADLVTPIDLTTNTALTPVSTGDGPYDLAVTPDGKRAYAANAASDTVSVVDTATDTVTGGPIPGGDGVDNLAITPDQAPTAVLAATASATGCVVTLDASASTVAFGTIAGYSWDFGDGTTTTTTTPTTTHTYAEPGNHTVTVTETSSGGTSVPELTPDSFTGQTMSRNADDQARTTATVSFAASCQAPPPANGDESPPADDSGTELAATGGVPTDLLTLGSWMLVAGAFLVYLAHLRWLSRRGRAGQPRRPTS